MQFLLWYIIAGLLLVAIGTVTYTLGADWHVIDAFYFSMATLSDFPSAASTRPFSS